MGKEGSAAAIPPHECLHTQLSSDCIIHTQLSSHCAGKGSSRCTSLTCTFSYSRRSALKPPGSASMLLMARSLLRMYSRIRFCKHGPGQGAKNHGATRMWACHSPSRGTRSTYPILQGPSPAMLVQECPQGLLLAAHQCCPSSGMTCQCMHVASSKTLATHGVGHQQKALTQQLWVVEHLGHLGVAVHKLQDTQAIMAG